MPRPNHPEDLIGKTYGTFYKFPQSEVLPRLSSQLKNYIAWMYKTGGIHGQRAKAQDPGITESDWLRYLLVPNDEALLAREYTNSHACWSTAGFFHATCQTIARDGRIISLADSSGDPAFTFEPIRVQCSGAGVTECTKDASAKDRFIFRVLDPER